MRSFAVTPLIPSALIAQLIRDEMRAASVIYRDLIQKAGIGRAEAWIEALAWGQAPAPTWGLKDGWYLYATVASEQIAATRHPRPAPHILAFGLRAWAASKARYESSGLRDLYAQ